MEFETQWRKVYTKLWTCARNSFVSSSLLYSPEHEVVFTLETQYVRCVLYCTGNGISGHVTEPTKTFVRNPKMYLVIDKPMKDYKEFKKMFKDNYLNIFAEHDACYYIENGIEFICWKKTAGNNRALIYLNSVITKNRTFSEWPNLFFLIKKKLEDMFKVKLHGICSC